MSLSEEEINRLNGASGKMDLPGDTTSCTIPEITLKTRDMVLQSMNLPLIFTPSGQFFEGISRMVFDEIANLRDCAEEFTQTLYENITLRYSNPMQTHYLAIERETFGIALILRLLRTQFSDDVVKNLKTLEPTDAMIAYFRQDFSFVEPPIVFNRVLKTQQPLIPSYQPHIDSCLHQFIVGLPDGAQFTMRATRGMYDVMEDYWKIIHPVNLQTDIKSETNPDEGLTAN